MNYSVKLESKPRLRNIFEHGRIWVYSKLTSRINSWNKWVSQWESCKAFEFLNWKSNMKIWETIQVGKSRREKGRTSTRELFTKFEIQIWEVGEKKDYENRETGAITKETDQ